MVIPTWNSPLKFLYLPWTVPSNVPICQKHSLLLFLSTRNSPFKCSYLPGTVTLNVPTCQEQSLYCSYLPETGRNRRRKQRRKRTGQCAADPKASNQSINRLISQRKKNPILGQSIKKIFIKIKQGVVLFKPKHKKKSS